MEACGWSEKTEEERKKQLEAQEVLRQGGRKRKATSQTTNEGAKQLVLRGKVVDDEAGESKGAEDMEEVEEDGSAEEEDDEEDAEDDDEEPTPDDMDLTDEDEDARTERFERKAAREDLDTFDEKQAKLTTATRNKKANKALR